MRKRIVLLAIPAALIAMPTAHADEQTFLSDVQGVFMDPTAKLKAGYDACVVMRAGASPDVAAHSGYWTNVLNGASRQIVDAAQHDLCPDTLH
jgi:hypothetical protein